MLVEYEDFLEDADGMWACGNQPESLLLPKKLAEKMRMLTPKEQLERYIFEAKWYEDGREVTQYAEPCYDEFSEILMKDGVVLGFGSVSEMQHTWVFLRKSEWYPIEYRWHHMDRPPYGSDITACFWIRPTGEFLRFK